MKKNKLYNIGCLIRWNKKQIKKLGTSMKKLLSWLIILSLLNLSSCYYFKVSPSTLPVNQSINEFRNLNKIFVLHLESQAWMVHTPEIIDDEIICYSSGEYKPVFIEPIKPEKPNRYKKNSYQSVVLNEVHIYVSEMSRTNNVKLTIPVSAVQKIEFYEKDKSATTGSFILGGIGLGALTFGIIGLIVALTKSSCPFIYDMNSETPQLIGEIYSGSVQPALERHDYLKIPSTAKNQEYKLKIANEAREIQHTNLMELWLFKNDSNTNIMVDKYGNAHAIRNFIQPENVQNLNGEVVTKLIAEKDGNFYTSAQLAGELPLTDGIIMEFQKPENAKNAKLAIRAKNSFVLDYMMGKLHDEFGDLHHRWVKKQKKAPKEKLQQWTIDQNIPLSLSVERNGAWEKVDYFNIAGPIAFKEDVLSFPLNGTESNPLRIKLEAGNFLWEIDYAALDYSANEELKHEIIPVKSAFAQNGDDVSKKLWNDDGNYFTQPEIGDEAIVTFQIPGNSEFQTTYLHSKGWYEIVRDPEGKPDREYLETFREPGRFNRFINDNIQSLAAKQSQ